MGLKRFDIRVGDSLSVLRRMDTESVDCVVTSPPYWGLRDYGVDGQLGLERTPEEYVSNMVAVFHEVRRVLRNDGTCWINIGDSYATGRMSNALKPKDLVGIPWRLAFALQADGWYLRADIIWHKPNPMPESVTDRPAKGHEYLFLLAKSERYFYDADAIKEAYAESSLQRLATPIQDVRTGVVGGLRKQGEHGLRDAPTRQLAANPNGRNKRTVWTVATRPFKDAHFATFPPKLIEPCILAGCRKGGLVLDPFNGAGTTGLVSVEHGRRYIGIELNREYARMSRARIKTSLKAVA
jgi:DNA modification methylase